MSSRKSGWGWCSCWLSNCGNIDVRESSGEQVVSCICFFNPRFWSRCASRKRKIRSLVVACAPTPRCRCRRASCQASGPLRQPFFLDTMRFLCAPCVFLCGCTMRASKEEKIAEPSLREGVDLLPLAPAQTRIYPIYIDSPSWETQPTRIHDAGKKKIEGKKKRSRSRASHGKRWDKFVPRNILVRVTVPWAWRFQNHRRSKKIKYSLFLPKFCSPVKKNV